MLLAESLAAYLYEAGAQTFFGVLGEANIAIATALTERGATYVYARREDAAVAMADGWSRRSQATGFCTVTSGPGLTNSVTGLVEAARRRTPLVLLTGSVPDGNLNHPQRLDGQLVVAGTGAGWVDLRASRHVAEDVVAAVRGATLERRPYVLNVPYELLYEEVDALYLNGVLPETLGGQLDLDVGRCVPELDVLRHAADLIAAAQRPLILAGDGAVRSDSRAALEELAVAIGGRLATSLVAKGYFAGDERHLGVSGGLGRSWQVEQIQDADLVLAFGCSLNPWTTMQGTLLDGALVIHCDLDRTAIGRWYEPDLGMIGDVRATAEALLGHLDQRTVEPLPTVRPEFEDAEQETEEEAPFRVGEVVAHLAPLIPPRSVIALDAGHGVMEVARTLEVAGPERFVFPIHTGAIGLGLGCALGAAIAEPDEWTFLFAGDGGLLMSAQELDTVRRLQPALIIVVLDDGAYGAEVQYCSARGLPDTLAYMDSPDFSSVADGFGITAHRIRRLGDLDVVKDLVMGPRRPALIHVPIDPRPMNDWYRNFTSAVAKVKGWTDGN
jgi:acetolactate synthase I/II/III large subunit